jgi:hypothetical protein
MAGMVTGNSEHLIRSELWSAQLKDVLEDDLMARPYVRWLSEFPDGETFTIPSIGEMNVRDYNEDTAITYDALDTGEFQFTISEYLSSATYITDKNKQDGYYMSELVSSFIPKQQRALNQRLEADIFKQGQPGQAGGHTAGNANQINGVDHRWVGADTLNSKRVLGVEDFAKARYALKKANVPDQNLIAIVDPSTEYVMNTQTNLADISNNPRWEGIVESGIGNNMTFVKNIYGFDVYTSNYLPLCGAGQTGTAESINSVSSGANAVGNLFFSASADILPYIGAWRQMPRVESGRNKDFQRDEYITTSRYGLKLYRPENFITVLSDPSAVV